MAAAAPTPAPAPAASAAAAAPAKPATLPTIHLQNVQVAVTFVPRQPLWWEKFAYGGLSCQLAAVVTNPIDVIKVRLQLQGELQKKAAAAATVSGATGSAPAAAPAVAAAPAALKYRGFSHGIWTIAKEEGARGLWRGLIPSLLREGSYSTIRMGAYDPIKDALAVGAGGNLPLWKKILAGALSGSFGASLANPTDLVKVRLQSELALPGTSGTPSRYKGTWHAFVTIWRTEGVAGLYRGVGPTTQRAMLLTASQLPSYDHSKHMLLKSGHFQEGLAAHCVSSIIAGFVCATTTAPIDLVKSRYMNQKFGADGKGLSYRNTLDCGLKTMRAEGLMALYKGWFPQWMRLGPHTIVTFLVYEQLRKLAGLKAV